MIVSVLQKFDCSHVLSSEFRIGRQFSPFFVKINFLSNSRSESEIIWNNKYVLYLIHIKASVINKKVCIKMSARGRKEHSLGPNCA